MQLRGWGSREFCARFSPTVGAECWSEPLRAVRALQPPSQGAFPHPLCRQNHSRPSHGAVETWSGSPTPPYAPNHKLMAAEQGKSFPPGERVVACGHGHWLGGPRRTSESGPDGAGASHRNWESSVRGRGCSHSGLALPRQHLCSSFPGTSDPKEDGLDAQISRLAGLIGRLENKVGPLSPHIHPSIPSPHPPSPPGRAELGWSLQEGSRGT